MSNETYNYITNMITCGRPKLCNTDHKAGKAANSLDYGFVHASAMSPRAVVAVEGLSAQHFR